MPTPQLLFGLFVQLFIHVFIYVLLIDLLIYYCFILMNYQQLLLCVCMCMYYTRGYYTRAYTTERLGGESKLKRIIRHVPVALHCVTR